MTIRFYMDENVPRQITTGLRLRGIDVLTVQEDGSGLQTLTLSVGYNHAYTYDIYLLGYISPETAATIRSVQKLSACYPGPGPEL